MSQRPIKSVAKCLDLLFLFSAESPRWSAAELAGALRLPLSTVYRYVVTLRQQGILEENQQDSSYRLSPRLLQLTEALTGELDLVRRARPLMEALARSTRETVQLMFRTGDFGTCVERAESSQALLVRPERGKSVPLHAGASMKAMLAFLRAAEQKAILDRPLARVAEGTITNPRELRRELEAIRTAGYAVSYQEVYPGVRAVAVPIRNASGAVVGSLGVAGPAARLSDATAHAIAPQLLAVAAELAAATGPGPSSKPNRDRAAGRRPTPAARRRSVSTINPRRAARTAGKEGAR